MQNHKLKQRMKSRRQASPSQPVWDDDWLDEEPAPMVPALRFSPTAWAKLLHFRDKTQNEVGGFGITAPDDLLFVQEFITVRQDVTCVRQEAEHRHLVLRHRAPPGNVQRLYPGCG